MEMSMEASEEMATQMAPRAMARAELLASAIGPAVSGLVRTRAQLAQRMAGRAWSRLLSERLREDRVRQGPLASRLSQTHGARSDCMPLNEETQLWRVVVCVVGSYLGSPECCAIGRQSRNSRWSGQRFICLRAGHLVAIGRSRSYASRCSLGFRRAGGTRKNRVVRNRCQVLETSVGLCRIVFNCFVEAHILGVKHTLQKTHGRSRNESQTLQRRYTAEHNVGRVLGHVASRRHAAQSSD